jgi:N-acetylmuramoyl-L-alanine amidase
LAGQIVVGLSVIRLTDLDVLARTIFGEARGEPYEGKWGVGRTIVNRWRSKKWFGGESIAEVCQRPFQYSCWNEGDPTRQRMVDASYDERVLRECMKAALDALNASPHLWFTNETFHYYADHISVPKWAEGRTPAGQLGHHLFFAGIS